MRVNIQVLILYFIMTSTAFAQSNWSALLPAQFPTNASGQIHGISRISQMNGAEYLFQLTAEPTGV